MKLFDKKFGASFFEGLPTDPGVYRIFNEKNELIYVGKAKNLRRRLGQYRNAKRRKKHHKMRKIVSEAAAITFELHASDHDATMAELKLIQELRPKWNVAGAFSFLYPMIGIGHEGRNLTLLYSTELEAVREASSGLSWHGAYRSRQLTGDAFFALVELLAYIGHPNPARKLGKYSYLYSFRQVEAEWVDFLNRFFRGEKDTLLESLILAMVERPTARRKSAEIQELLDELRRFWRHEARALGRICGVLGAQYPVSQRDRDLLLLQYRHHNSTRKRKGSAPESFSLCRS